MVMAAVGKGAKVAGTKALKAGFKVADEITAVQKHELDKIRRQERKSNQDDMQRFYIDSLVKVLHQPTIACVGMYLFVDFLDKHDIILGGAGANALRGMIIAAGSAPLISAINPFG